MSGKEVIKLLEANGWYLDRITGSHHIMVKEHKTIVVPLHGKKDLPKGTLNKILKLGGLK